MLKRKGHLGAGAVSEGLAIFIKIEGYFCPKARFITFVLCDAPKGGF